MNLQARIQELEAELDQMRLLKESLKAGYKEIFDGVGVGMALVSLDGMLLDVNDCFCQMLGRSEEELVTLNFQDVTYPDDINPNLKLLEKLRRREIPGYRMEKRYVRSNGTIFWGDLTVAAQRDENGEPIKLISVVVDITQKKEDEERFKFVMDELAHRTKNMAAVIQSIVNQTSVDAITIDELRAKVADRLTGIVASQESMTRLEGRGAVLRDLVEQQLAVFLSRDDPRVVIQGPDLTLNPDATRAIGMALHELATNALKYGSLSVPPGKVSIAWEATAAGQFHMLWKERGGPVVRLPERTGFGRRVIERMAAISTNGKVDLKFDPEGIEWRIEAHTASVVEG